MLALDVATKCGVAFDRGQTLYIATVVGSPTFQRDWIFRNTIYDEVVIEELVAFNSKNPKILVNLAQRVGYIYHRFIEEGIKTRFLHPGSCRKNLGLLQSKAGTRELQIQLKEMFKVTFNLDEVDSIAVWLFGMDKRMADITDYKIVKLGIHYEVG